MVDSRGGGGGKGGCIARAGRRGKKFEGGVGFTSSAPVTPAVAASKDTFLRQQVHKSGSQELMRGNVMHVLLVSLSLVDCFYFFAISKRLTDPFSPLLSADAAGTSIRRRQEEGPLVCIAVAVDGAGGGCQEELLLLLLVPTSLLTMMP